jgi:hypothetical protein
LLRGVGQGGLSSSKSLLLLGSKHRCNYQQEQLSVREIVSKRINGSLRFVAGLTVACGGW